MDVILIPLFNLLSMVVDLYIYAVLIMVILNWLISFGVVNSYNQFISKLGEFLFRLTEPVLQPIRRFLPNLGGIDLSPIALILLLHFVREIVGRLLFRLVS